MIVDVHAHYYPDAFARTWTEHHGTPMRAMHADGLGERVRDLDETGIDRQIISAGALMPYLPDPQAAVSLAQETNRLYADAVARHPGRFGAFGVVPLPHVDAAVAEAARCLDDLGFAGIALGSGAQGLPIDDEAFDPFWRSLDERGAVVYLHPGVNNSSPIEGIAPDFAVDPSFGSPSETARCVARLALAGWGRRYPRLRIVVANWGGLLPAGWPHFARALRGRGDLAALDEIRRMWFDTGTVTDAALLSIAAAYGVDRLVLGTDATYGDVHGTVTLLRTTSLLAGDDGSSVLHRGDLVLTGEIGPGVRISAG